MSDWFLFSACLGECLNSLIRQSPCILVKSVNLLWQMLSNSEFVADLEDCIPLKHVAETHEITSVIAFLCMPCFFIYNWTNHLCWWWLDCTQLHTKIISWRLKFFGANSYVFRRRPVTTITLPKLFGFVVMWMDH